MKAGIIAFAPGVASKARRKAGRKALPSRARRYEQSLDLSLLVPTYSATAGVFALDVCTINRQQLPLSQRYRYKCFAGPLLGGNNFLIGYAYDQRNR